MSPANDPMTFDELSELYRVEMRVASLTPPRKDLFRAMANLLTSLRQEYDRQMSKDPDSVMTEGADQRRKKAERLCKDILVIRSRKIAVMAIRGAEGGKNALDTLTEEERAYYDSIVELTRRQLSEVDRLRGKRVTIETRIDEPPPRAQPEAAEEPTEVPDATEVREPVPEPVVEDEKVEGPAPEAPAEEPFPFDDGGFDEPFDEPYDDIPDEPVPEPVEVRTPETDDGGQDELVPVLIRVLEDLPTFAGPDRDYSLAREDLVTLPRVLADVLVNSGKATLIKPTPRGSWNRPRTRGSLSTSS